MCSSDLVSLKMKFFFALTLVTLVAFASLLQCAQAHARVIDPPQRGSLWRFPEYAWANPGHQADDAALVCGDKQVTDPNNGACGVCGDSILDPVPRKHEIGGEYERGIVVRNYTVGQVISVTLDVVAGHRPGFMHFKLCPYSVTGSESHACFDQYPLLFADGSTQMTSEEVWAANDRMEVRLPALLRCER